MKNAKIQVLTAVLFLALAGFCATAHAIELRINLVFDNGTVLIYQGKEAGIKEGQVLEVARGGRVIGTIEVFSVTSNYAQARIVNGQGTISENDIVIVGAAPIVSPGVTVIPANEDSKKKKADGAASVSSGKDDKKSSASKKSDSSKSSASDEKEKSDKTASSSKSSSRSSSSKSSSSTSSTSSKRRSSRTSSSDDSDSKDDSSSASSSSSSSSGRSRSRGSSSSSSSDSDFDLGGGSDSSSGSSKEQVDAKVLAREPKYSLHMGYLFVDDDLPGVSSELDPAFVFTIDYWIPRKRHQNLVYSLLYSRPDAKIQAGGQTFDYQLRMIELSMGLVWDDISNIIGSDMYGGFSVGWRNAHTEVTCSVTCGNSLGKSIERSQEGVDYHGILGFKVNKRSDVKLQYSFDEKYYTIDAGFAY